MCIHTHGKEEWLVEYIYRVLKRENKRGKIKERTTLLLKGRGYRQSRFVNMELRTASAVQVQVFIYVGIRENHATNTEKPLLIISGYIPCESNSSCMRQLRGDEVRKEI